jgi:hypothetical protein
MTRIRPGIVFLLSTRDYIIAAAISQTAKGYYDSGEESDALAR